MALDDLVSVLKEAEGFGFTQKQRHEVSIRYHQAEKEFLRLTGTNKCRIIEPLLQYHAAVKAREYIRKHKPQGDLFESYS